MINTKDFFISLQSNGIDFFTGVPDSLLKDICAYITDETPSSQHIIAANEGGALALAIGHHLSTGSVPLIYMQNSGIGNIINPLLSLADKEVYSIPMLMLIGWRGEPGVKDEPQHIKQGKITLPLLESMGIAYTVIDHESSNFSEIIANSARCAKDTGQPYAIVVRKGTFEKYRPRKTVISNLELTREAAICHLVDHFSPDDIVISTTGMASRELYEYREAKEQGHSRDFLTVGGMGHASQIALGISLQKEHQKIYCIDGDGAALMHLGAMAIIADNAGANFIHIVINNGAHGSVGGQPTVGFKVDFQGLAESLGYSSAFSVETKNELLSALDRVGESAGPLLLEIKVKTGNRSDLGRPTTTPAQNKNEFMQFLSGGEYGVDR